MSVTPTTRSRLIQTLRAWPVITFATLALCLLTQQGAKLFGIDLPEQTNIEIVRRTLAQTFDSRKAFVLSASIVAQVVVLMPVIEELVFRGLLFKGGEWLAKRMRRTCRTSRTSRTTAFLAVASSALFSAVHYLQQPWPDDAFLALFFFGLAQCGLYLKTGSLWCAMLNHALFNLTNLVLLVAVPATSH